MIAGELDQEPNSRADNQVHPDDLAGSVRLAESPVEESENQRLGAGFVQLCRMQCDLQWNSGQGVGLRVVELHRPGELGFNSPAATRGKATQLADRVPQRQPRSERVRGRQR